jgi:CRP-like cAMP-binding protein
VDELTFVLSGEADVFRNGARIATVYAGSFVGEMTCLSGAPATATVVVRSRMHCFTIKTAALREHVRSRPQALEHLERSFSADLRRKLQLASDKLVDLSTGGQDAGSPQTT